MSDYRRSRTLAPYGSCAPGREYDLAGLGNFHPNLGSLPLSDDLIATAPEFDGWGPSYLCWPKSLWTDPAKGVPDHNLAHNAFHCRRLAEEMRTQGRWVGRPLMVKAREGTGRLYVYDGNHRLRAVQWLAARGVVIEVPITWV